MGCALNPLVASVSGTGTPQVLPGARSATITRRPETNTSSARPSGLTASSKLASAPTVPMRRGAPNAAPGAASATHSARGSPAFPGDAEYATNASPVALIPARNSGTPGVSGGSVATVTGAPKPPPGARRMTSTEIGFSIDHTPAATSASPRSETAVARSTSLNAASGKIAALAPQPWPGSRR